MNYSTLSKNLHIIGIPDGAEQKRGVWAHLKIKIDKIKFFLERFGYQ